ncbi:unnamed protein product, partial [Ilex paraguariensis]
MRALLDGLSLIYDHGLEVYDWEINTDYQSMDCRIQHVYREGNSVADALANQGVMDQSTRLYLNQGTSTKYAEGADQSSTNSITLLPSSSQLRDSLSSM